MGSDGAKHKKRAIIESAISRRSVVKGGALGFALLAAGELGTSCAFIGGQNTSSSTLSPGQLPFSSLQPGTDTMPYIEHIVVVMLENHSYDNILGITGIGDGFTSDLNGNPTNFNLDPSGNKVRAFPSPTACRAFSAPSQSWNQSHISYANGTNSGFVDASGVAAMAYYPEDDIPFTVAIAKNFAVCDRYFSSMLGPTFPNRRFLISGTSMGMINDFPSWQDLLTSVSAKPPSGTIFEALNKFNISWKNYNYGISTLWLYPYLVTQRAITSNITSIGNFYSDAKNGTLPQFSLIDPNLVNFIGNSEGEGDDIVYGDQFLASIFNALAQSPSWDKTLLIWTYDEAGGYYDHVVPFSAPPPDNIAPQLTSSDVPGAFNVYGFRVPFGMAGPFVKRNYVSHTVMDHTSILKLLELKWNLPCLTYRDANANAPLDMLNVVSPDLSIPPLPAPASTSFLGYLECEAHSSQTQPSG